LAQSARPSTEACGADIQPSSSVWTQSDPLSLRWRLTRPEVRANSSARVVKRVCRTAANRVTVAITGDSFPWLECRYTTPMLEKEFPSRNPSLMPMGLTPPARQSVRHQEITAVEQGPH